MQDRLRSINTFALSVVVAYTAFVAGRVAQTPLINPVVDAGIVFLTSVGFYLLLVEATLWAAGNIQLFLMFYWGKIYVDGLWSYSYTIDGDTDGKVYFGVWKFEQNLYSTGAVGFGLSDDFIVRSRVRSVTDMIANGAMYEFVMIRSDSIDSAADYYSRTNMFFEMGKGLFKRPVRMRGKTFIYGGPRSGRVCNNLFVRHEKARTEQDVIDLLRENFQKYGKVHVDVPAGRKK